MTAAVARPAAALGLAAGLLSSCSSGAAATRAASPSPTPTPTRTPTPATTAATQPSDVLQRLADRAEGVSYTATYRAQQRSPVATQTWRVWRTTTSVRVDVVTRDAVTTMIVSPRGAFSCRDATHGPTCFRVAAAGRPVPPPFNLAPYAVFSTDLVQLARHIDAYDVHAAVVHEGALRVPVARCFALQATERAPEPAVDAGTYCVSASGLVTGVTYPSGNTVTLTAAQIGLPAAGRLAPYATPTPLPT